MTSPSPAMATPSTANVQPIPVTPAPTSKRSRLYCFLYDSAMLTLYKSALLLEKLRSRKKNRLPVDRPLRVFRLVSVIAQGGVAKVCLQTLLATDPQKAKIHLTVFDSSFPLPTPLRQRTDIEVQRRRLNIWMGYYNGRVFRNIWRLAGRMRQFRPDVIHVHEPQFAPVVRMASIFSGGAPVFVHLHNDYNERWETRPPSPMQGWMIKDALRASNLIACSATIHEAAERWLQIPLDRIHLIEDGANDLREEKDEDRLKKELLQAARGRKIIVKMSHIIAHKRIDDYLTACRLLLDEGHPIFVLLMCYGKRNARKNLIRQFESMFAPWEGELLLHVPDPQALLKDCHIGVSASALEGLGLNILEFQMAGLPVICTDLQPHREMVEDGKSGLLYPVGDIAQLTAHLRNLLNDEALAKRIGEGGRLSASKRTWKKTADNTLELYRTILSHS